MILGGNQPYFVPYLGYWQLVNAVDVFIVADDYKYIERGWINRNRILINGQAQYFNIELERAERSIKRINEINISPFFNRKRKLKQLEITYKHAPFYNEFMPIMKDILEYPDNNLTKFLVYSINELCSFLNISTKIEISSNLHQPLILKGKERFWDFCNRYGANEAYNAIGGKSLYLKEEFLEHGVTLRFLRMNEINYQQFGATFVPNLSIIDVIMFNGKSKVEQMLNQYTLE